MPSQSRRAHLSLFLLALALTACSDTGREDYGISGIRTPRGSVVDLAVTGRSILEIRDSIGTGIELRDTVGTWSEVFYAHDGAAQYARSFALVDTTLSSQVYSDSVKSYLGRAVQTAAHEDTVLLVDADGEAYNEYISGQGTYTTTMTSGQWGSPYYPCIDDLCPVTKVVVTAPGGDTVRVTRNWWTFDGTTYHLSKTVSESFHDNKRLLILTNEITGTSVAFADSSSAAQLLALGRSGFAAGQRLLADAFLPEVAYAQGGCGFMAQQALVQEAVAAGAALAYKVTHDHTYAEMACDAQSCANMWWKMYWTCLRGESTPTEGSGGV